MRLQNREMRSQSLFSAVHTYSLFMNLKNFVCNIGEDAELLMSLYDPDQSEFIRSGRRLAPPPTPPHPPPPPQAWSDPASAPFQ